MAGNQLATRGTMQAAPPPSVTESQRRLLADPFRLDGEADVPWKAPAVRNPAGVKRVVDELERGLTATRPLYLKWICDKLSALPTQASTGLNAALWADNVIDTCAHYPEDLLQAATLEVLRTKTFRPSPAEIVAVIEPRYRERERMLERARSLLAPITAAEQPFKPEPEDVRMRATVEHYHKHRESFLGPILRPNAVAAEQRLAEIENRAPEDWALEQAPPSPTAPRDCERCGKNHYDTTRPTVPTCPFKPQKPGPSDMPLERPASPPGAWRAGHPVFTKPMPSATASDEPPMPDEIPE